MNRSIRNNIARETRRTVAAIRQNAYELSCALESAKSEDDALELVSSGLDIINDAAEVLGVEVDYKPSAKQKKDLLSTGRKGVRFQMLLPEAMMMELRSVSESSGVSKNEILCRALKEYLSGSDYE